MNKILHGDCLEELKAVQDNSIDLVCTDPPYGYSFMGKDWDKAVPSVEIWKECLRVLKPGAFCFVMSAPRSDVQNAMVSRLMQAGFRLDFTPIYWTYASGFPKAGNIGKLVDKRLGAEREIVGTRQSAYGSEVINQDQTTRSDGKGGAGLWTQGESKEVPLTGGASTPEAKALDGSYAGFQPKPAVEVIIVAMKPLSEKTYVDQALANGKGISWLDDARIPTGETLNIGSNSGGLYEGGLHGEQYGQNSQGRFPANLLVSDDVLNDGRNIKSGGTVSGNEPSDNTVDIYGKFNGRVPYQSHADSGSYSRYFDLDKWAQTLPFLIVPKASKSEKNKGLDGFGEKAKSPDYRKPTGNAMVDRIHGLNKNKNHHPTVKPLKLMSYLITLGSREDDIVLDPFVGSGTTCLAAKNLGRKYIGIEREAEYVEIAKARLSADKQERLL